MAKAVKPQNLSRRRRGQRNWIGAALGAAAILLVAGIAAAQTRSEPPNPASDPPAAAPAPAPPPAAESPGFVGTVGNWMQQGVTSMSTGFNAMVGAAKGAADAASGRVAKGRDAQGAPTSPWTASPSCRWRASPAAASSALSPAMALPTAGWPPRHCAAPAASALGRASISKPRRIARRPIGPPAATRPIGSRARIGPRASAPWNTS